MAAERGVARDALLVSRVRYVYIVLFRALNQSAVGCGHCRAEPNVGESTFGSASCIRTARHSSLQAFLNLGTSVMVFVKNVFNYDKFKVSFIVFRV